MKYRWIILSALLMGLSQQPINCGWLAWFALFPLIKFLDQSEYSFKERMYMSLIWGFIYHFSIIYWLLFNIGMTSKILAFTSLIASTFVLMINTILIVILYSIIAKNRFNKIYYSIPLIWVTIEYIRTFSVLGFP